MKKLLKVISIILSMLIVLGIVFFIVDYDRVKKQEKPIFCIKNPAGNINDGGTVEYFGLGYKVIDFHTLAGFDDIKIGTWFMKYKDFEIEMNKYEIQYELKNADTKNLPLEELPEYYTMEKAIEDGCFVISNNNKIYNKNKLAEFIANTNMNAKPRQEASLRIVFFTIEGDMIIKDISYNIGENVISEIDKKPKSNYVIKIDNTRDKYAAQDDRKITVLDDFPGVYYGIVEREKNDIIEVSLVLYAIIDYVSPEVEPYEEYLICTYSKTAIKETTSKQQFKIIDTSKAIEGMSFAQALEEFYRDELYIYSFPCIMSNYIIVEYEDGSTENIVTALKNKNVKIEDLDRFDIAYCKEPNEEVYSFFGTVCQSNASYIVVEPNENEEIRKVSNRIFIDLDKENDVVYMVGTNVKITTYSKNIVETNPVKVKALKIEIKSTDNFNLVFYQKTMIQPKQKEVIIRKGEVNGVDYNVYSYEGYVGINLDSTSSELSEKTVSLSNALLQGKITMNEIIEKANRDFPNATSYDDGGSIEYHYDNYTIIKLHTLDGNRDVYIGVKGMNIKDVL